jgi:rsbT co-antagonist protein RsbR
VSDVGVVRNDQPYYQQMIESITEYGVIRLDGAGIVRTWHVGAERMFGYAEAEIVGRSALVFYTEEEATAGRMRVELNTVLERGRYEAEGWRERRDGSRFWSSTVLSPIREVGGELIGYVRVARDMTERREQEQLVQRQRDEILELSTAVIEVWEKVLVLPIIGTLDSARAARLTENLLDKIATNQAEVAILDVSGVPAIDTDVAQHLLKTVEAARLMGTVSVLSGVRPGTAQAIVHLGIELGALRSRASLSDALQLALSIVAVPERIHADA